MSRISLSQANQVIAGAFAKGAEAGFKPLSVAVVDAGGHVIAFQRADGGSFGRLQVAQGKAAGALALGVSSRKVGEMAVERPWFIGASLPGRRIRSFRRRVGSSSWMPRAARLARSA